ncbi:hypothetical protein ACJ73_02424 [Blastomyces percursus]|uniref:Uncharacterized protein n=1 Tax=Blastomyces percursus TaxID=1658174 RepID=A0A1J9QCD5_9EURO|nr:hypothetical protein ACJ73_02424 [Blastomyces percursus]
MNVKVEKDIWLILQLLPQLQKPNSVRLRVFMTSRPELPIRLGFKKFADHDHEGLILHEIAQDMVEHDISLFLDHHFRIDENLSYHQAGLGRQKSICRIFEDPDWDPADSLTEILTHQNDGSKLAGLYLPLLETLLNRQRETHEEQVLQ